jgi:hypothetical protein
MNYPGNHPAPCHFSQTFKFLARPDDASRTGHFFVALLVAGRLDFFACPRDVSQAGYFFLLRKKSKYGLSIHSSYWDILQIVVLKFSYRKIIVQREVDDA